MNPLVFQLLCFFPLVFGKAWEAGKALLALALEACAIISPFFFFTRYPLEAERESLNLF